MSAENQTTALQWVEAGAGYIASCGEHQQGDAIIHDARGGGYVWHVDMLPLDMEPAIYGVADTLDAAKHAAERQVAQWPMLIEGAWRYA